MGPQADGAETGAEPEMSGESLSDQWPLGAIMVHTSVQDLNCWDLQGLSLQLPLVQMHVGSLIYQQRSHVENIDLSWQKDGIRWKIYSAKSLLSPLPDLWFFPTFLSTSLEWSGMSFKKKASLPSPSCSGVGLWWYIYVWPSKFAESLFWETCGWITSQESKILLFQLPGPFGDPKLTTLDDNGWRWNNHFFCEAFSKGCSWRIRSEIIWVWEKRTSWNTFWVRWQTYIKTGTWSYSSCTLHHTDIDIDASGNGLLAGLWRCQNSPICQPDA